MAPEVLGAGAPFRFVRDVLTRDNPERDTVEVYFFDRDRRDVGARFLTFDGATDTWTAHDWPPGRWERPKPAIELPREALAKLVEEHLGLAAPQRALAAHLDDAVKVRDRLLAIVERKGAP